MDSSKQRTVKAVVHTNKITKVGRRDIIGTARVVTADQSTLSKCKEGEGLETDKRT